MGSFFDDGADNKVCGPSVTVGASGKWSIAERKGERRGGKEGVGGVGGGKRRAGLALS